MFGFFDPPLSASDLVQHNGGFDSQPTRICLACRLVLNRLALLLVVGFGFSAAAQSVSPSWPLAKPVLGAVTNSQTAPTSAALSGSALSVWEDRRDDRTIDLYGTRISETGTVVDVPSLALVRGAGAQTAPALAASNTEYLLAYLDDSVDPCGPEVMAIRVSANGAPQGAATRVSTGACSAQAKPSVAWSPSANQWLIVWGAHGAGQEIHGALIALDGVALPDFLIASAANSAREATAVSTTNGFLAAWEDDRSTAGAPVIYAATVTPAGVVGTAFIPVTAPGAVQRHPVLANNGNAVLMTWVEATTGAPVSVWLAGLDASGTVLFLRNPKTGTSTVANVTATSAGSSGWFIAYDDARAVPGIFGVMCTTTGVVSVEVAVTTGSQRSAAALASVLDGVVVIFRSDAGDYMNAVEIFGMRVIGSPPVVTGGLLRVSTSATRARSVRPAWNGERYLAAWRDDGLSPAGGDIVMQTVAAGSGALLGPDAGFRLTTNSAILGSLASVAANDGGFFVSFGDFGSGTLLEGQPISGTGVPLLGPQRLNDTTNFIASHESRWFIDSWVTVFSPQFASSLSLRRTATTGLTAQAEVILMSSVSTLVGATLRTAQSQDVLMIVFQATGTGADVLGARWQHGVGSLDSTPLKITQATGDQTAPCIAGSPDGFLVAWVSQSKVFAARVDRAGVVLDAPLLLGDGSAPALTWASDRFLAVWVRGTDLVGARVSTQGVLLDATPFIVSASSETQLNPALASGPAQETLVTYEAFDSSPSIQGIVARARFIRDDVVVVDAGVVDAGVEDAGVVDAGVDDAGTEDSGVEDAGVIESDAGTGEQVDGGVLAQPKAYRVGCSCDAVGAQWAALIALATLRKLKLARRSNEGRVGI